jgi:hypothetical protein
VSGEKCRLEEESATPSSFPLPVCAREGRKEGRKKLANKENGDTSSSSRSSSALQAPLTHDVRRQHEYAIPTNPQAIQNPLFSFAPPFQSSLRLFAGMISHPAAAKTEQPIKTAGRVERPPRPATTPKRSGPTEEPMRPARRGR